MGGPKNILKALLQIISVWKKLDDKKIIVLWQHKKLSQNLKT